MFYWYGSFGVACKTFIISYQDLGNGRYTAKLVITEFTDEDAARKYLLVVRNDLGTTEYKVQLSVDPAPRGRCLY